MPLSVTTLVLCASVVTPEQYTWTPKKRSSARRPPPAWPASLPQQLPAWPRSLEHETLSGGAGTWQGKPSVLWLRWNSLESLPHSFCTGQKVLLFGIWGEAWARGTQRPCSMGASVSHPTPLTDDRPNSEEFHLFFLCIRAMIKERRSPQGHLALVPGTA